VQGPQQSKKIASARAIREMCWTVHSLQTSRYNNAR